VNAPIPDPDGPRELLQSDLIDQACDEFESNLRAGRQPRIEDYLVKYHDLDRRPFIYELVALEIDYLQMQGKAVLARSNEQQSPFAVYYQRFPDCSDLFDSLKEELELTRVDASEISTVDDGFDSPADTTVTSLNSLRSIKQFELRTILGRGNFGIVWRAWDSRLRRYVALKVPRANYLSAEDKRLFLREARAAAKLSHSNIIKIYEVSEDESEVYIASELVVGISLKDRLDQGRMQPRQAAALISTLAKALFHAHQNEIIHRDLKPANIVLDLQDEPHVADFGMAKWSTGDESLASEGQIMGTPAYMSPEQTRGDERLIDSRTDIYSLGCILFEALTGKRPFAGEIATLLGRIQQDEPGRPRSLNPEIPKDLELICLKCLAKDRNNRYATAQDLANDLNHYLAGESLTGIPAHIPDRMKKWFSRHRRSVVAITISVILAAGVAGGLTWQFRGTASTTEMYEVAFTTAPEGCEITAIAIDQMTGEPVPSKIYNGKGRTPLKMNLAPADYLIVVVLKPSQAGEPERFHEVYRHVPASTETIPYAYPQLMWTRDKKGGLSVPVINIPGPEVPVGMGFVEGTTNLVLPKRTGPHQVWKLPPYYVDLHEITKDELRDSMHLKKDYPIRGPEPIACVNYFATLISLENQGKRPPSAAELYYLSTEICPPFKKQGNVGKGPLPEPACELSGQPIEGLHSGNWEWTSTVIGGPFSGFDHAPKRDNHPALLRMIGCGQPGERKPSLTGFLSQVEPDTRETGVRGVRSARPRRKAEDFAAPISVPTVAQQ
jgi:serine/threonine protein kinase